MKLKQLLSLQIKQLINLLDDERVEENQSIIFRKW